MYEFYENCIGKVINYYEQAVLVSESFIFTCLSRSRISRKACDKLNGHVEQEFDAFSDCLHLPENVQAAIKNLPVKHKRIFIRDRRRCRKLLLSKLRYVQNFLDLKDDRSDKGNDITSYRDVKCPKICVALEIFGILLRSEWSRNLEKTIFISGERNCILTLNRILLLVISANSGQEDSAAYTLCPLGSPSDQHHCVLLPLVLNILKIILNYDTIRSQIFDQYKYIIVNLIILVWKIRCYSKTVSPSDCLKLVKCKILILQILGGLCLFENGHAIIFDTINRFKILCSSSKSFFQDILDDFTKTVLPKRELSVIKVTIISLINALLDKLDLEARMALRSELLSINEHICPKVFDWLRENEECPALLSHVDLFRMAQQEDEETYNENKGILSDVESINPNVEDEQLFEKFSSVVKNQSKSHILRRIWKLAFKQIVNDGLKNDLVDQLSHERDELSDTENDGRCTTNYKDPYIFRKSKMEYKVLEEKCEHLSKRLRETEHALLELQLKCNEKSMIADQLVKIASTSHMTVTNSESVYHSGSISDNRSDEEASTSGAASIVSGQVTAISSDCPNCTYPSSQSTGSPMPIAPAPPPNILDFFAFKNGQINSKAKRPLSPNEVVIADRNHLKTLNWTIIPETQLSGSLWLDYEDDSGTEDFIDLENLNKNFSSVKPAQLAFADNQSISTMKNDCDSVLNPRRAQNCQILLSKLKFMDVNKLCSTVADLDPHNLIGKDMIEQLLKFIPNREEEEKLVEKAKVADLALVDRFFYHIIRNPTYERRLRCLWIIKTFDEKALDLKNQIEAIIRASKLLQSSKRVKKVLFAVLSLGNRLNRFKQIGTAKAFDVGALNRLIDIKSVIKTDYTLLHFLVDCCDAKSAEIFRLKKEISAFSDASKVCTTDIYSDLKVLDEGFDLLRTEAHESVGDERESSIQKSISEFLSRSEAVLSMTRVNLVEMHEQFGLTLSALALDERRYKTNPSELFAIFSRFLTTFCEVRRQLKRERLEIEKRQATLTRIPKVKRSNFQKQFIDTSMDIRSVRVNDYQKRYCSFLDKTILVNTFRGAA
uniref:FH2 domain-containing protein n=1 Tax=Romanomermis culicivorax TaxID=13658 RepID=A0A915IFE8_ROMCU